MKTRETPYAFSVAVSSMAVVPVSHGFFKFLFSHAVPNLLFGYSLISSFAPQPLNKMLSYRRETALQGAL